MLQYNRKILHMSSLFDITVLKEIQAIAAIHTRDGRPVNISALKVMRSGGVLWKFLWVFRG